MLFKQSRQQMGVIIKNPTQFEVPKDLKRTIAKDRKEVAAIDDAQEAAAFNVDSEHYMELSAKPFLELEGKLELKNTILQPTMVLTPMKLPQNLSRPLIGRSHCPFGLAQ